MADVALFAPVEIVAGTACATPFLNEPPRVSAAIGAAIVLAGVF